MNKELEDSEDVFFGVCKEGLSVSGVCGGDVIRFVRSRCLKELGGLIEIMR